MAELMLRIGRIQVKTQTTNIEYEITIHFIRIINGFIAGLGKTGGCGR